MNVLDAYVTKVIGVREETVEGEPFSIVDVEYDSYGVISYTNFWFKGDNRQQKAAAITTGHHFLS